MNIEKIVEKYIELSEHFRIPMPKIHHYSKLRRKKTDAHVETKVSEDWKLVTELKTEIHGSFGVIDGQPTIVLVGKSPTLEKAILEFMHYLVYCVENGLMEKDTRQQ